MIRLSLLFRLHNYLFICLLTSTFISAAQVDDTALAPCSDRAYHSENFRVEAVLFCLEHPLEHPENDIMGFTSLHFAPDDTLYATHPLRGEVVQLVDNTPDNDDALPDSTVVIAENLRYPHGLASTDDALYIVGDGIIYRYDFTTQALTTFVEDLPAGQGFLMRGVTIYQDALYLGIPMPCDLCTTDDPERGSIVRLTLDGNRRDIIATGFRYPSALTVYNDSLLVTDTAHDAYGFTTFYDEINQVDLTTIPSADAMPHYGFPECVGDNIPEPDFVATADCSETIAPLYNLQTNSTPFALIGYRGTAFDWLEGSLIVGLMGAADRSYIAGHAVVAITPQSDAATITHEGLAPSDPVNYGRSQFTDVSTASITFIHSEIVNRARAGFFPQFVYGVAVSPEGWIYFSTQADGVYVLRPRVADFFMDYRCRNNFRTCN